MERRWLDRIVGAPGKRAPSVVGLLVMGSVLAAGYCSLPPRFETLAASFDGRQPGFESLQAMFLEDDVLRRVFRGEAGVQLDPRDGVDEERRATYAALLDQVEAMEVMRWGPEGDAIAFPVWHGGWGSSTSYRYFIWHPGPKPPSYPRGARVSEHRLDEHWLIAHLSY